MKKMIFALCISIALFADANWESYTQEVLSVQKNLPGWCPIGKARHMMDLVYETKPEVCVEIGVFGGSSLYPTACALRYLDRGVVYAIDPWARAECLEGYALNDPNYQWWKKVSLEQIYRDFTKMLDQSGLYRYCTVMRMAGGKALEAFADQSIDILHIDGNHTEESALRDAQMYLAKVKEGGYIWFDDVNWSSTRKALEFLSLHCEKDELRSTNTYVLFKVIRHP